MHFFLISDEVCNREAVKRVRHISTHTEDSQIFRGKVTRVQPLD